MTIQSIIPQIVGRIKEITDHLKLPVSFLMVIKVVLQGKCKSENSITLIAVRIVHPFAFNISPTAKVSSKLTRFPLFIYAIRMIGKTISFAGRPSINAVNIYPSNPINLAKGFKKFAIYESMLKFPILIFAKIQITIPTGAATATALPKYK